MPCDVVDKSEKKECSKERGCDGKVNAGSNLAVAIQWAEKLKTKYGKDYGVYKCPHCGGHHLTTKLYKKDEYRELLYITSGIDKSEKGEYGEKL